MTGVWALLLLLGVAAAAPPAQVVTYDQAIASAVNLYNQQKTTPFAFRLLEAEPQPNWDPRGKTTQGLKFTIKETVCPSAQSQNLTQCNFKEDGVDQDCSGTYSTQQEPPNLTVQCENIDQELNRITRSRWRRFIRGAGRFARRYGWRIALGLVG
ncbi:cathelicidin-related peptide Oh-Cath-like [Python bivittatus]|uniref:Vipericidin n=1 Tax=Python bivittatus TaxID=176946 RepID=A0A2P1AGE8_PYTBI|nr:cathelicidin-related peptide Oh-Cath-like [Python bivittatus]AVI24170.1 CATHPb4 antimicrobial peptide [Python bivittatus]